MRRVLAIVGIAMACSSCTWQEWTGINTVVIPLTQGIRDVVESFGGDPTRAGYAVGVATGGPEIAIDEAQFNALGDTEFWMEHERMHIAYARAGTPFGDSGYDHEHWANCGAELVLDRDPPFVQTGGYDDCSDEDVARLRWVLTERLGVTFP